MPTYNGWNVVEMPDDPPAPQSFDPFTLNAIVASNTNPFTGQQQIQDWGTGFVEASVVYPTMKQSQAQAWIAFFQALRGMAGVFQFPSAVCTQFPLEMLTGSPPTTPRYWRLKENSVHWGIKPGPFYSLTFDIREAI
jgi:hypothetical protein